MIGWRKDAEAAGRFIVEQWRPLKRGRTLVSADVLAWVGRWAGHWGRKELQRLSVSGIK